MPADPAGTGATARSNAGVCPSPIRLREKDQTLCAPRHGWALPPRQLAERAIAAGRVDLPGTARVEQMAKPPAPLTAQPEQQQTNERQPHITKPAIESHALGSE